MTWYSTKSCLPDLATPVIVCRRKADGSVSVEAGSRMPDGWWKIFGSRTRCVTHWMPMPEPPEVEG